MKLLFLIFVIFHPETDHLGPYQRFSVSLCNQGEEKQRYTAAEFWSGAKAYGMIPATQGELQRAFDAAKKRSTQRTIATALEIASYAFTACLATDACKIKESYKAIAPIIGGSIRVALTAYPERSYDRAPDAYPGTVEIPAGECAEYSLWGVK